jgi:prepilin-type N-terminal cleavage/methylation domain-containing protein
VAPALQCFGVMALSPVDDGFTLVEVVVAILLMAVLAGGTASLLATSARTLINARAQSTAVQLATNRMEQLRSLPWGYGAAVAPLAGGDSTTDLSAASPSPGGPGLAPSPATALEVDVAGLVDHLDNDGRWVGNAPGDAAGATFTRRWRVDAPPGHPDLILIHVRVVDRRARIDDLHVSTARARTAG